MPEPTSTKPLLLVTGSSGLIGTRILQALAPRFEAVGLDVEEPEAPPAGVSFLHCDLTKDASVAEAIGRVRARYGARIASVVHLAAYYDFSGAPSPLYGELTVEGTRRLVRHVREVATVEQVIFSSSLLAMRPVEEEGQRLTERSPLRGEWDYPRSKIEAERVLLAERGAVPVAVLRLAGVYDEDGHSLPLAQQVARIYERRLESYLFPGDASHGQPFLHLDDAVTCFAAAIDRRGSLDSWETFLIAERDVLSYAELQEQLGRLLHGKAWPTIRVPKPAAKLGAWLKERLPGTEQFIKPWMIDLADDHYPVEIRRARERLGWQPRHRLADVLPEMIARFHRDPADWYRRNGVPLPALLERQERSA